MLKMQPWWVELIAAMTAVDLLQVSLFRQQIILEVTPNQKVHTIVTLC